LEEKLTAEFTAVTKMKEEISRKIAEWREATGAEQDTFKRELSVLKESVDEVLTDSQKVQGSFQELNVKYKTVGEAAVKAMKQIENLKKQLSQVNESHREASKIAAASEVKLQELERIADNLRDKNSAFEKRLMEAEDLQENFKQNSKEVAALKESLERVSTRQSDLERKERDAAAFMTKLNGETASVRDWLTAIRAKQSPTS
jgi:chromosome segregation ATPase